MRPGRGDYEKAMNIAADYFGVQLGRHTNAKAHGPCPRCGGNDRFIVWLFEGNGWCSHCHYEGWFIHEEDREQRAAEARIAKEQMQRELRCKMAECRDWYAYHTEPGDLVVSMWQDFAHLGSGSVSRWGLGYCQSCPLAPEFSSLTIPVFFGGKLMDIRHRLMDVPPERRPEVGKYRSHMSGLVPHPFNMDAMSSSQHILIIEGEKKPIDLMEAGMEGVVGIPGISILDDLLEAANSLQDNQTVTIGFDPGADRAAEVLAYEFVSRGVYTRIADFFMKPDDIRQEYGIGVVKEVIKQARRYS